MAKRIKNPIEVRAVVYLGDGSGMDIQSALIRYGVTCEHLIVERKEIELIQNPEVHHFIRDFIEEGLEQADTHEGIAEEDSLLEYPRPT